MLEENQNAEVVEIPGVYIRPEPESKPFGFFKGTEEDKQQWNKELALFQQLHNEDPDNSAIILTLAKLHKWLGNKAESSQMFTRLRELQQAYQ